MLTSAVTVSSLYYSVSNLTKLASGGRFTPGSTIGGITSGVTSILVGVVHLMISSIIHEFREIEGVSSDVILWRASGGTSVAIGLFGVVVGSCAVWF